MTCFVPLLIAIAGVCVMASPTLAQDRGPAPGAAPATDMPPAPGTTSAAQLASRAEQAGADSDWSAMAILAAASYRESPGMVNEFNLATAYAHTGRTALAIPLYADVVQNGKFTQGTALYDYRHGVSPKRVRFNFSDEANRRLALLTGEPFEP